MKLVAVLWTLEVLHHYMFTECLEASTRQRTSRMDLLRYGNKDSWGYELSESFMDILFVSVLATAQAEGLSQDRYRIANETSMGSH